MDKNSAALVKKLQSELEDYQYLQKKDSIEEERNKENITVAAEVEKDEGEKHEVVKLENQKDEGFEKLVEKKMQPLRFSDDESVSSPPRKSPRIVLTLNEGEEKLLNSSLPLPKEIVLRLDGLEADNKRKNMTFYSPTNQTTIFIDLDIRIVQSERKNSSLKASKPQPLITQRRKRALSFNEATMRKPKSPGPASSKIRTTPIAKPPARTKLPNNAAIHQKNLVDHVNRKAERAKILTNSATKSRLLSAQKTVQNSSAAAAVAEKSKVVKRINLQNIPVNTTFTVKSVKTSHTIGDSKLPMKQITMLKPMPSTTGLSLPQHSSTPLRSVFAATTTTTTTETAQPKENKETMKAFPNPRLGTIEGHTFTIASTKNKQTTSAKNVLKPMQPRQAMRPAFNPSTALESHAANNVKSAYNTTGTQMFANNVTTTKPNIATPKAHEMMASRWQRHMDMFKGRTTNARTTPGSADKSYGHQIRGVRSNRRFELQMAHRNLL